MIWLVVLRFNATLTAKVISWRSVTHISFLTFSHQLQVPKQRFFPKPPTTFPTCFCRGEKRKYASKKVRLNWVSNSQPPGLESDTFSTEPSRQGTLANEGMPGMNNDEMLRYFIKALLPFWRLQTTVYHITNLVSNVI